MTQYIEQFLPGIRENGFNTQKAVSMESTLTVTGSMAANGGIVLPPGKSLAGGVQQIISGSGATATLTAAQTGSMVLFDRAAGIVFTLPAPAVGLWFEFAITVSITSNSAKIITDAGGTLLIGSVFNAVSAGTGTQFIANGSTHIAMTQNGTTTGGLIGSGFLFSCVSATLWVVEGTILGSGTVATPFATS